MQLRILKGYHDVNLGRGLSVGEVIEVDENRARELLKHPSNIVEALQPFSEPIEDAEFREPSLEAPLQSPETFRAEQTTKNANEVAPESEPVNDSNQGEKSTPVEVVTSKNISKKKDKKKVRKYKGAKK